MLRRGFACCNLSVNGRDYERKHTVRKPLKPLWNIQNINASSLVFYLLVNSLNNASFI